MVGRISAAVVVAFWAVMMVALVRTEYLGERGGAQVPAELVLRKVFSQESPARLNILYEGKVVGFCKIDIDQAPASPAAGENPPQPESSYLARSDLTLTLANFGFPARLHIEGHAQFSRQFDIGAYQVRVTLGDNVINLSGDPKTQQLLVDYSVGAFHDRRTYDLRQFQNGGLPSLMGMAGLANLGLMDADVFRAALPKADALSSVTGRKLATVRTSHLRIAGEAEETYLIETRLDETLWARIWVSKQGEVLKVDSSARVVLLADTLTDIQSRYPEVEHDSH